LLQPVPRKYIIPKNKIIKNLRAKKTGARKTAGAGFLEVLNNYLHST